MLFGGQVGVQLAGLSEKLQSLSKAFWKVYVLILGAR